MVPQKHKKNDKFSRPNRLNFKRAEKPFMKFYALAFELVVMNAALIIGGYFLDQYLSTSPAMILVGVLLAVSGTIWLLIRAIQ